MSFVDIGEKILEWGKGKGIGFLSKSGDYNAMFAYVTNEVDDCYQISIQDPEDYDIMIYIFPVEIRGNDNFRIDIDSNTRQIINDLDFAYDFIMNIMANK